MSDKRKAAYEARLKRQTAVSIALAKRHPLCLDGDPNRPLLFLDAPVGTRLEPEFLQKPKSKKDPGVF
jgi:hypothetical protein